MRKFRFAFNILTLTVFSLAISSVAQAQATRTWVSGVGDDANPCSRTAPCKTFAGAISKTAAGGEISVLDPGGFGAVTITKAITLDGDGTLAGILAATVNGIIINAGVNDVVVIRNLAINGTSGAQIGLNGIRYLAGKQVIVEKCTIQGFSQKGIDVNLSAAGRLDVNDTTIATAADGITMTNSAGVMHGAFFNVRIMNTTNAALNMLSGSATISDSKVTNNTSFGIIAQGGSTITVERTVVAHNGTGLATNNASATIRISNVTVNNNTTGLSASPGAIVSFQNNSIAPAQGAPTSTLTQQ
jgi:Right handed beta helix region